MPFERGKPLASREVWIRAHRGFKLDELTTVLCDRTGTPSLCCPKSRAPVPVLLKVPVTFTVGPVPCLPALDACEWARGRLASRSRYATRCAFEGCSEAAPTCSSKNSRRATRLGMRGRQCTGARSWFWFWRRLALVLVLALALALAPGAGAGAALALLAEVQVPGPVLVVVVMVVVLVAGCWCWC